MSGMCGSCGGTGEVWNPMSGTWGGECPSCDGMGGQTCKRCHENGGMIYVQAKQDWEECEHEDAEVRIHDVCSFCKGTGLIPNLSGNGSIWASCAHCSGEGNSGKQWILDKPPTGWVKCAGCQGGVDANGRCLRDCEHARRLDMEDALKEAEALLEELPEAEDPDALEQDYRRKALASAIQERLKEGLEWMKDNLAIDTSVEPPKG